MISSSAQTPAFTTASVTVGMSTLIEFVPNATEVCPKLVVPQMTSTDPVAAVNWKVPGDEEAVSNHLNECPVASGTEALIMNLMS